MMLIKISLYTIFFLFSWKYAISVPLTNERYLKENIREPSDTLNNILQEITQGVDYTTEDGINNSVKFYLYTRMNVETYQELVYNNESSIKNSYIDFYNPTTIIVHGYCNSIDSEIIQLIKKNLLNREKHNVIGVDWSEIAYTLFYSKAADSVPEVGQYLSKFIQFLVGAGQSLSQLHLIGHSLGAHVVGLAGLNFTMTTQEKIPRITGLDPAKPGFESANASQKLDISDAAFVDCIHTCSGELGLGKPVCTSDFYPNGASGFQPGCFLDIVGTCSHSMSYKYYAESIQLNHRFHTQLCESVPQDSTATNCSTSNALMGDPATPQNKGIYLVLTNDKYPYAKDIINSTSI